MFKLISALALTLALGFVPGVSAREITHAMGTTEVPDAPAAHCHPDQ